VAASLLVVAAPASEAHHRPNVFCSYSGDICQSVRKHHGVRKLTIVLAEKYFGRYVVCVSKAGRFETCARFKVTERGNGLYGDTIRWRRHFSSWGRGRYVVTWYRVPKAGPPTDQIGRKLGFHVR